MNTIQSKQLWSSLFLLLTLGMTSSLPEAASQTQLQDSPQLTAGIYIPPPERDRGGVAGDSTIGQERSREGNYSLITMMPVKTEGPVPVISEQPTLWFYVPEGCPKSAPDCSLKFELVDYSTGETLFEQAMDAPQQSGLVSVQVAPVNQPLQVERNYRWRMRVVDKVGEKTAIVVFGNFEPVTPDTALKQVIASASTAREKYTAIGKKGHWFETLSGVLQQYAVNPSDTSTTKDLQSLSSWVKVDCKAPDSPQAATEDFIPLNCVDQVKEE